MHKSELRERKRGRPPGSRNKRKKPPPALALGDAPDVMTVAEAARVLQVPRLRCYELIRLGTLPAVRLGRQIRVAKTQLINFMNQGGQGLAEQGGNENGKTI